MFEIAELGNRIDKETYAAEGAKIREGLLQAQRQLAEANFSVIILIGGVEGAGKPEMVNLLLEWMDARGIQTHALGLPSDEERDRPPLWRFWRLLPPRGRIGIFFGSWYTLPIVNRVLGKIDDDELDKDMDRDVEFERMLHNEDTLILKFWLHLSKSDQKTRFKKLEGDPRQKWRV